MERQFQSTVSVGDLQQDAAAILDRIAGSYGPTAVTRGQQPAVVLMSLETYEQKEHERRLLVRLARGEREIASGEGYDLDQILGEADDLLKSVPA